MRVYGRKAAWNARAGLKRSVDTPPRETRGVYLNLKIFLPQMLKIYLKKEPRPDDSPKVSLKGFVSVYLNQFYIDVNDILGDYRSIQEHGNRNKIIEFTTKKIKDIELFFMIVKGAYLQRNLHVNTLKRLDYIDQGVRMVEMADFIAGMFENMKLSFIPRHNFKMALQAAIDPGKLLIKHSQELFTKKKGADGVLGEGGCQAPSKGSRTAGPGDQDLINFEEINRLIKIYLLKENIQNYDVKEGILFVYSDCFTFELVLCGMYSDPKWKIINIRSANQSTVLEQHLLRRIPSTIKDITAFISLHECRRNAQDVFDSLQSDVTGFYQNFEGKIDNVLIRGLVRNTKFVCTIYNNNAETTLINKKHADIISIVKEKNIPPVNKTEEEKAHFKDYNSALFGENYTIFIDSLFLCFSKAEPVFYIGEYPAVSQESHFKVGLKVKNGHMLGSTIHANAAGEMGSESGPLDGGMGADAHANPDFPRPPNDLENGMGSAAVERGTSSPAKTGFPRARGGFYKSQDYFAMINAFVDSNREYFAILHRILGFCPALIIDRGISSEFFDITLRYSIHYSKHPDQTRARTETFASKSVNDIVGKAMLICIQRNIPDKFTVIENKIGEKIIFEIHKVQVLLSSVLKTALKYLTEDCRRFNFVDGLSFIWNFGALYRYSLLPSTFTRDMLIFNMSELTGEYVAITKIPSGYSVSGPKTIRMLKISKHFAEDDYRVIGVLYKAYIINRFHYLRKLLQKDGEDKDTLRLPNGSRIVLTPEGLKFFARDGSLDPDFTHVLNTERNILGGLRIAGEISKKI